MIRFIIRFMIRAGSFPHSPFSLYLISICHFKHHLLVSFPVLLYAVVRTLNLLVILPALPCLIVFIAPRLITLNFLGQETREEGTAVTVFGIRKGYV